MCGGPKVRPHVVCSSKYKLTGETPYDFTVKLGNPFEGSIVKLTSVSMPANILVINSSNNTFEWVEIPSVGPPGVYTVSIPVGNYDVTNIASALSLAMNAAGATGSYGVVYSTLTNKITISASGTLGIYIYSITALAKRLGFTATTTAAGSMTGDSQVFLGPPLGVLIQLSCADNGSLIINGTGTVSGTFYLPLGVNSYDLSKFTENADFQQVRALTPGRHSQFRVRVLDLDGLPVILESDWEFTLGVL